MEAVVYVLVGTSVLWLLSAVIHLLEYLGTVHLVSKHSLYDRHTDASLSLAY